MDVKGAVAIPESSSVASPTESVDSALGDSPRPAGNSGKYLSYGGPGFSVASFDAVTGSFDRIPVPLPLRCGEMAGFVTFPQSPVLCMAVVGETQVWLGTKAGSLHVFELERSLRFSSHAITTLDSSILCITSHHWSTSDASSEEVGLQSATRSLRTDVLIGTSNSAVSIVSGEANPHGGLHSPGSSLRRARKVLNLGRQEEGEGNVSCIAAATMTSGVESFWCSCGRKIVVFRKDGWNEIARLDATLVHPKDEHTVLKDSESVQLVSSAPGIWSALSNSLTISLWDSDTWTPKLHITCCSMCDAGLYIRPQITALNFTYPHLFVGTDQGDLIAFRIYKRSSTKRVEGSNRQHSWEYKVMTAEHCSSSAVLDIFATPLRTEEDGCRSLFRSMVTTPTSLQVLVVCGQRQSQLSEVVTSNVFCYELVTSPTPSPLTSPMQLSLRPPSGCDYRCSSAASCGSTSSVSTSHRRRVGTFDGSLPRLSFYSASPNAHSLLPLRSS
jgi:hypothetical protein